MSMFLYVLCTIAIYGIVGLLVWEFPTLLVIAVLSLLFWGILTTLTSED